MHVYCLFIVPIADVSVTPVSSDINAFPTSTAILTCEVVSFSTPTITWTSTATDQSLPSPAFANGTIEGLYTSTLIIFAVFPDNEGSYTCTVENSAGIANDTAVLNVIS